MELKEKERRKKKKEKKRKELKRTNRLEKKTQKNNKRNLNVIECESIQIGCQKHNEMIQRISSWVPVPVKSAAFI